MRHIVKQQKIFFVHTIIVNYDHDRGDSYAYHDHDRDRDGKHLYLVGHDRSYRVGWKCRAFPCSMLPRGFAGYDANNRRGRPDEHVGR